jgi:uncharacterized protein DUF4265
MTDEQLTKVHIDLPNHWGTGGESLWASNLGADRYRIENIPFYAYNLNLYDVVEARPSAPDLKPSVLRVLERSGHNTIRVLFSKDVGEADRIGHLYAMRELHVEFERCSARYFALDLEPDADVGHVRERLDTLQAAGCLEYETCEARMLGSFDDAPGGETPPSRY